MKRYGNLYKKIYDLDNLRLAHKNAKKGKGWYKEVQMIDKNPDFYLKQIQTMLINHTYKTSEYRVFYKDDGNKTRKIYKLPYFPDRICQWAILQVIEPILIRNLTVNTYSAIPGRGIHKALHDITRDIKHDSKGCQYCLKIDVRHYYQSINHSILKKKYARIFKDPELLWLLGEIIDSINTADNDDLLSIYNTFDNIDYDTGIPIGNYISQYSGNFYLSDFDHWIKEVKGVKYYYRYMDDIVILHESKEYLHKLLDEIKQYFMDNLKVVVKSNYQAFPTYKRGIDYVGYRIFQKFILLRKSTCKTMKRKLISILNKVTPGNMMNYSEWCSINSYKGWLLYCNSYRLCKKYVTPLIQYSNLYYTQCIKKEGIAT